MNKITLADGTVIQDAYAMPVNNDLFIYISGNEDIRAMWDLLSNTRKTKRIRSQAFGTDETYLKYTDIRGMSKEDDGSINARLRKAG